MDTSAKALEEAISIRRQIDNLERRLSSILGGAASPTTTRPTTTRPATTRPATTRPVTTRPAATPRPAGRRYFSPATRAKLAAAAKARWARLRGGATTATPAKKGQLTPAGRRKLSQ